MIRLFFVFLIFMLILISDAKADIVNDFIRIDCNQELNYLQITSFGVNGWLPANNAKRKKTELFEKHGIIDLMSLFEINSDFTNQKSLSFETSCQLDSEDDPYQDKTHTPKPTEYKIRLEGYFQNDNPGGICGGWRSYTVTIKRDAHTIVDNVPYEINCGENTVLGTIRINPHEGYISAGTPDSKKTFWQDKDLPITQENIYAPAKK